MHLQSIMGFGLLFCAAVLSLRRRHARNGQSTMNRPGASAHLCRASEDVKEPKPN